MCFSTSFDTGSGRVSGSRRRSDGRWGEAFYQAETIRVRGDLHRRAGDDDTGEARYLDAIALAQVQGAKLFELRATASLARLWQSQKKTQEASEQLAVVYDWFTEGFDTADMKEA